MRIRKPLHRNANSFTVNILQGETAINVGTTIKGWNDDGRHAKAAPSRQASPAVSMLSEVDNLAVDRLWHVQDGNEHATRHYVRRSVNVASCKTDVDEVVPADDTKLTLRPDAIGASNSKLISPRLTQDSDGVHPLTAPEGSLLHTLYLHLLAAGSEGITLRELYSSFKKQTALPSFEIDWKEEVRSYLKTNPHFDERLGHYFLCTQLVQQQLQLKRSPTTTAVSLRCPYMGVSPRTTNTSGRPLRITYKSPAVLSSSPAMEKETEGVQTRRKAYEKTINAVLTESAMEFEKMQRRSVGSTQMAPPGSSGAPAASDCGTTDLADFPVTLLPTSRKRKCSSDNEEPLLDGCKTIRGSLQALHAKIVAETGVQNGVPCARKDDARKWRCPLMAMEGHTLCKHHKALQLRKNARKQGEYNKESNRYVEEYIAQVESTGKSTNRRLKAELCSTIKEDNVGGAHAVEALVDLQGAGALNTEVVTEDNDPIRVEEEAECELLLYQTENLDRSPSLDGESDAAFQNINYEKAIPGSLKALQAKIVAESGVQNGVRCARKDGSNDSARKWQCPLNAMEGHTLCGHHNFLKERKRARYAASKQTKKETGAKRRGRSRDSSDMSLPESHIHFDELPPRPLKLSEKGDAPAHLRFSLGDTRGHDKKLDHSVSTEDNVQSAVGNSDVDVSNAELAKNAPKRWYVAAKKTAAMVDVLKEISQDRETSPFIRPPTIPPLPAIYGVRRKAVKNRSLLSL